MPWLMHYSQKESSRSMRGWWGTLVLLVCCSSVRALAQQDFSKSGPASGEDLAKLNSIIKMTNTLMKHGRLHEADSLLKTNLKCCFPNNFSLLEQYGLVLHHLGKQKLAIKQYEKALHLSPHHLGVAGLLSNLALSQEEVGNVSHLHHSREFLYSECGWLPG